MEGTGLKKKDLKRFRDILLAKKKEILRNAQRTLNEDMTLDADDLPDEMDLASSEYLQSVTFRLRGREKSFLDKIQKALVKIEDGSFGKASHKECDHSEKVYESLEEVRVLPEQLFNQLRDGFDALAMSVRDAKNSDRQGSSSDSSPLPSKEEESTPSTPDGVLSTAPGT